MQYNIHPIFVHFPIAFLLLYSLIKIIPFEKWFPKITWDWLRFIILTVGVLGAFVANMTGEIAEHLTRPNHNIVEMHSTFAGISTFIYTILLIAEFLVIVNSYVTEKFLNNNKFKIFTTTKNILTNKYLMTSFSVIGIIAISITGLLGGVMVYGTEADPFANIVLKILGL